MNRTLFALACAASLVLSSGCGDKESDTGGETTETATATGTTTTTGTGTGTGTGTTTGTATGGTGTATGTATTPAVAADYCAAVTTSCTGADAQYDTEQACLDYVNIWSGMAPGVVGDTSGDTIGCREYHAGAAATDAATHCEHAGPTGGNVCGSWCDNYCDLAMNNCSGNMELFADTAACMTSCAMMTDTAPAGSTTGDSVQCRIYHLGLAGSDMAGGSDAMHCPHAAATPTGPCQ